MTNNELRSRREQLGLPALWCATHIGRVKERTWRYWEAGREGRDVVVPAEVVERFERVDAAITAALAN